MVPGTDRFVAGPFSRIEYLAPNLNSVEQVKDFLFTQGWIPDEFNESKDSDGKTIQTSPKLTESSFHTIMGQLGQEVARRAMLLHRRRMLFNISNSGDITGLITYCRDDSRIPSEAFTLATPTGRMRHRKIVNIPGVERPFGSELRKLFIAPEGRSIIGCDAAALEARIQAHYVYPYKGGKELADLLLNGDIHQSNADLWGVTRKQAKSPYYCLMYGGQPTKLSHTLGCSLPKARRAYNDFWMAYTPLQQFKDTLVKLWEKRGGAKGGYLKGLDGRKLLARSSHSLVNLMIQSAGSIAVKAAVAIADKRIRERGLDAKQIIIYHDEVEYEVADKDVVEVQQLVEKAFSDAGKLFKLNVELKGEAKVGKSWYDVH